MTILERIADYKRTEIASRKRSRPPDSIEREAGEIPSPRGFAKSLRNAAKRGFGIIAEIKRASPSKGLIREEFDPEWLARSYESGGAACISVLTDGPSFQGSSEHLTAAAHSVSVPIIRKDFMLDPYQVAESRVMGADCILIIMAMVSDQQAREIKKASDAWGMDALVEVHDEIELERACELDAQLIGINNRNLKTFEVSLETTKRLAPKVPKNREVVAESGLASAADLRELAECGVRRFLIGESLMRSHDIETALRSLVGAGRLEPRDA